MGKLATTLAERRIVEAENALLRERIENARLRSDPIWSGTFRGKDEERLMGDDLVDALTEYLRPVAEVNGIRDCYRPIADEVVIAMRAFLTDDYIAHIFTVATYARDERVRAEAADIVEGADDGRT